MIVRVTGFAHEALEFGLELLLLRSMSGVEGHVAELAGVGFQVVHFVDIVDVGVAHVLHGIGAHARHAGEERV